MYGLPSLLPVLLPVLLLPVLPSAVLPAIPGGTAFAQHTMFCQGFIGTTKITNTFRIAELESQQA